MNFDLRPSITKAEVAFKTEDTEGMVGKFCNGKPDSIRR